MAANDGGYVTSPGYVVVKEFCVGNHRLRDVKIAVADVTDVCAPAYGLLGLDLFPRVGITIEGVPYDYPRSNIEDELIIDVEAYHQDWLDKYAVPTELRSQLMEAISLLLKENADIPSSSFCTHPAAKVSLETGDAKPVYVPQYRLSDYMSQFVDKQVANWEHDGVVCDAPADSPWNFPLLAALDRAARAKGKDPRVCIDPRLLNNLLPDDPRSIPNVDDIHARLRGFDFISEIDMTKSFNQIVVALKDRIKTTFTWRGKKRMFVGAPFGLKPLSQLFQSIVEQILHDERDYATPFIDNIYVHTNGTFEDHIRQVCNILKLLNKFSLRINMDKCYFGYTAVNVLGHLLSGTTKSPDPSKRNAVQDWQVPTTGNDIESFLGFTNYLRQYIPLYADIAAPLEKLRKVKKIGNLWSRDCQRSFDMFKRVINASPILNVPLSEVPFCLQTDASQFGLGWVLYQIDPDSNKNRYVLFGAKALSGAQVNYSATRRELLAIIVAIRHCHNYLYGYKFKLYTDHMALSYLFTQKYFNYMMLNWIDTLLDYDFTVIHRPGIELVLPDALSRMFSHFRGGNGSSSAKSRVAAVAASVENANFADRELSDFITSRFAKKFLSPLERPRFLDSLHSQGHFGAENLFKAIWNSGYYWPGLRMDCQKKVNSCLECLRFNVGKSGYHPRTSIHAELPFEHISVDTITGFPETELGNTCILVITCMATRFKLLYAQKTHDAPETAVNLWKCISTFPTPKILQSDNGTEFCNQVVKALTDLHGIDHRRISSYNPRANGSAENAVGSTQVCLRKALNGNMTHWDLYLPAIQLALNAKPNDSTKSSPASLLFGMNIASFANYDRANSKLLTTYQLLERAKVMQDVIRPAALKNFKKAQKKRTDAANKRLRLTDAIEPSTLVMLKDITRSTKHQPIWIGPYRVVRQKKGKNYVLENPDGSLFHREPPRDHLKVIDPKAEINLEDLYYVERILDHKGPSTSRKYLVKWLNFPAEHNSWEPTGNLEGCEQLLTDYWNSRKSQKSNKR